ncbi:SpoIIE family protein phosphatase [Streptomyces sp. 71268]|uniref:SpoIIE family protein phosphatase n=1 Tax=Streptomyces sp. 71268 TaxID=3002640 RepID=UPI0023F620F9|nr:SpoIIE family protein phosphatase [Streptomyces sp. 71268]WEV27900.1 SpoIIE family protein phosphatase [Streptomyces sp. 71268]
MGTGVNAQWGARGAEAVGAYEGDGTAVPRPDALVPGAPPGSASATVPAPGRICRTALPGDVLAPAAARRFVRDALADWAAHGMPQGELITGQLRDDAVLLVSELVTNAVVHAGTGVVVRCALEPAEAPEPGATLYAEVTDHHPARAVRGQSALYEAAPEAVGTVDGLPRAGAVGVAAGTVARGGARAVVGGGDRPGSGLRLVGTIADSWGTIYRRASKTVWFRLPVGPAPAEGPTPTPGSAYAEGGATPAREAGSSDRDPGDQDPGDRTPGADLRTANVLAPALRETAQDRGAPELLSHGGLSFLAEASDLLAGQFDADKVALLAGQLLVPRLADWCAVWLETADAGPAAPWVWHASESEMAELRRQVGERPPTLPTTARGRAVPWPWPGDPAAAGPGGAALACGLVTGGRSVGTLLIGRSGLRQLPDEVARLFEDLARRVALAVVAARQYTRQAQISEVLQRGLLPSGLAAIPGMDTAVVYEPAGGTCAGGDFYDVFPAGDGRWCFALGDVCGNGPEAAVVTGLARPVLRLLAREGYGVTEVLDRLNRTLGEKAVEAAASAVAAEGPGESRFLSLLYGELVPYDGLDGPAPYDGPDGSVPHGEPAPRGGLAPHGETVSPGESVPGDGPMAYGEPRGEGRSGPAGEGARGARRGVRCTLASAGHPLPLLLRADGGVVARAAPQLLLGVLDGVRYESETFDLLPGETLLCVTDGVTERRSDHAQFDDDDGLARALAMCAGLSAQEVAQRVRTAVHAFGAAPPNDDLAMLVLKAAP